MARIMYELLQGIPSDIAVKNIQWKVNKVKNAGYLWYSPTMEANGQAVVKGLEIMKKTYNKYGFEAAMTTTMIEPHSVICATNGVFDKTNEDQRQRALNCYNALVQNMSEIGIETYRVGIAGMKKLRYPPGLEKFIIGIKKEVDPNNIIAPGRYFTMN